MDEQATLMFVMMPIFSFSPDTKTVGVELSLISSLPEKLIALVFLFELMLMRFLAFSMNSSPRSLSLVMSVRNFP